MRIRETFAALLLASLVLLAGCGGDQSSKNQSGEDQSDGKQEGKAAEQQAKPAGAPRVDLKIALGTISAINPEKRRLYIRPTVGEKAIRFRVVKKPHVILNGRRAELADVEKGQQAKIEYFIRKDLNRARSIVVFGTPGGGKKKTGEGSKKKTD